MRIYCTKKLHEFIGDVEETLPADHDDIRITDWNAHLFYVERKKCLVFVNILTYYCVFITDITKKDVKGLDQLLMKRMREQLIQDKFFSETEKALHLMTGAEVRFIKTNNNKKVIGRINDFVYTFKVHLAYKYENLSEMNVVYENGLFNSHITGQYGDKRRTFTSPVSNLKNKIKGSV